MNEVGEESLLERLGRIRNIVGGLEFVAAVVFAYCLITVVAFEPVEIPYLAGAFGSGVLLLGLSLTYKYLNNQITRIGEG